MVHGADPDDSSTSSLNCSGVPYQKLFDGRRRPDGAHLCLQHETFLTVCPPSFLAPDLVHGHSQHLQCIDYF